jgi:predicted transcriptional regulator
MQDTIKQLLNINYTNYYQLADYSERAYIILNRLNRKQLIEIVEAENIYLANKNCNIKELKKVICGNLVEFRCDRQCLGLVAAHSYRESRLG